MSRRNQRTTPTWTETTIRIHAGNGYRDHFAAWVSDAAPGLAVNRYPVGDGYTITHIASGERLPVFNAARTKVQAAAVQLAQALDWTRAAKALRHDAAAHVALRTLPTEVKSR